MNRRRLLALLGLLPAAATALPVLQALDERSRPRRIRPAGGFHGDYFSNLPLRTQDGTPVRFYDDLLAGKTVAIHFFRTGCTDGLCPVVMQNLVQLQRLLGDRCGRDVFMYSFTLAPEEDTPERLRRFREQLGVGPGWAFLTGARRDLEVCRARLGFTEPDPRLDRDRSAHTNRVLFGNEPHQRWMASPALTRPEFLLDQINRVAGLQA